MTQFQSLVLRLLVMILRGVMYQGAWGTATKPYAVADALCAEAIAFCNAAGLVSEPDRSQ